MNERHEDIAPLLHFAAAKKRFDEAEKRDDIDAMIAELERMIQHQREFKRAS